MKRLKCAICGKEVSGSYWIDEWGNCVCAEHEYKMCSACHRFIGRYSTLSAKTGQIGYSIDKDRYVCGLCQETCVNSKTELDKSIDFVVKLLGRVGFKIVKESITGITVITKEEMNEKSPNARGLCISKCFPSNPKLTTAEIFILNGLPKILLESVLAHEMLHFWVNYNGVDGGDQTEGFCNIGEALVLNYYAAQTGSYLADHLRADANNNPDYYYGHKFIEQKKKLQRLGWKAYINDILESKTITP